MLQTRVDWVNSESCGQLFRSLPHLGGYAFVTILDQSSENIFKRGRYNDLYIPCFNGCERCTKYFTLRLKGKLGESAEFFFRVSGGILCTQKAKNTVNGFGMR